MPLVPTVRASVRAVSSSPFRRGCAGVGFREVAVQMRLRDLEIYVRFRSAKKLSTLVVVTQPPRRAYSSRLWLTVLYPLFWAGETSRRPSRLLKKSRSYPVRLGFGLVPIPIRSVNKAVFQQPARSAGSAASGAVANLLWAGSCLARLRRLGRRSRWIRSSCSSTSRPRRWTPR